MILQWRNGCSFLLQFLTCFLSVFWLLSFVSDSAFDLWHVFLRGGQPCLAYGQDVTSLLPGTGNNLMGHDVTTVSQVFLWALNAALWLYQHCFVLLSTHSLCSFKRIAIGLCRSRSLKSCNAKQVTPIFDTFSEISSEPSVPCELSDGINSQHKFK